MRLVLDASAAVEIALEKEKASIFLGQIRSSTLVLAPDSFVSEVTNVFWKYRKFQEFNDEICLAGIEFCINLVDVFVNSKDLWREAYFEGIKNGASTYDMFYLVVAKRNSSKILTCDRKLSEIARSENLA